MQFLCDLEKLNSGWGKFTARRTGLKTFYRNKIFTGE